MNFLVKNMMKDNPLVSIIIVNLNGQELVQKCLESLEKITFNSVEIILVDNNSTDNTVNYVSQKFPNVILIKLDENKGFAEPNNIASKIAKGEYLLFLNNDTIVKPDFISELINVFQNDNNAAICQSFLLKTNGTIDSSGDFIDKLGVVYNSHSPQNSIREISSARGAAMMIKKTIFEKLNGFDEKFFATFEDVDLGWRAWISGYRILLVPNSVVYHLGGETTKFIKEEIAFHGFKNQLSMKITNFESNLVLKKMIHFFLIYGIREMKIWFDYKFHGKTNVTSTPYENDPALKPNFKIIIKSIVWILKNRNYLIKKQKMVKSQRKFSTKQLEELNILSNNIQ